MNRHTRAFLTGWIAVSLTDCSDSIHAPPPDGNSPDLRGSHTPTVITDLGTLGGTFSLAVDVSDAGVVVGRSETAAGSVHAFRWTNKTGMQDLGSLGDISWAVAVNKTGYIVGSATAPDGETHLVLWTPEGALRDLGNYDGALVQPSDINDRREIIGTLTSTDRRAFRWTEATGIVDLGFGTGTSASANNDRGAIAGEIEVQVGPEIVKNKWYLATKQESFTDIGSILGLRTEVFEMNNRNEIVGATTAPSLEHLRAVLWTSAGGFQDLGTFGGASAVAHGINNRSEVVGVAQRGTTGVSSEFHPFYWTASRGMVDLGRLAAGASGTAFAINDKGLIVGEGPNAAGDELHAMLWTGTGGAATPAAAGRTGSTGATGLGRHCVRDLEKRDVAQALMACLQKR